MIILGLSGQSMSNFKKKLNEPFIIVRLCSIQVDAIWDFKGHSADVKFYF